MNEYLLEKIDRYLEGKMNEEERAAFETEAEVNKELSSLLAIYSGIETEMRENFTYGDQDAALRQTLNRLNAAHFTGVPAGTPEVHEATVQNQEEEKESDEKAVRGKRRNISTRRLLLVAAACAGIVILGITFRNSKYQSARPPDNRIARKTDTPPVQPDTPALAQKGKPADEKNQLQHDSPGRVAPHVETTRVQRPSTSPEQQAIKPGSSSAAGGAALFAANFKPDAAPADRPDALGVAFDLYEAGDYKTAANYFNAKDASRGEEDKNLIDFYNHYYRAQIYLAENNASKALPELATALKQSPGAALKAKTEWYLSMAYLKNGEWQQAMDLLKKVSRRPQAGPLGPKAAALLGKMKKE